MTLKHPNQVNHHENAFDNPVSLQNLLNATINWIFTELVLFLSGI